MLFNTASGFPSFVRCTFFSVKNRRFYSYLDLFSLFLYFLIISIFILLNERIIYVVKKHSKKTKTIWLNFYNISSFLFLSFVFHVWKGKKMQLILFYFFFSILFLKFLFVYTIFCMFFFSFFLLSIIIFIHSGHVDIYTFWTL